MKYLSERNFALREKSLLEETYDMRNVDSSKIARAPASALVEAPVAEMHAIATTSFAYID